MPLALCSMSPPGPPSDVEVEWQLDALDLRPVERWLALRTAPGALEAIAGLSIVAAPAKRLVDAYVDTEDWRMGRAGYVLRVRRRAGRIETTLKDLSSAKQGLRRRLEVTQPLPVSGLSGLDRTGDVGWRVEALAGAHELKQVLEVRTHRRPFGLEIYGERVGELALDDTVIAIGHERRRLRLTRVEVEVLPAWVDAMQPFVERLRRECGLQPATLSKFEAGLMAAGLSIPGLPDLGPTAVSPPVKSRRAGIPRCCARTPWPCCQMLRVPGSARISRPSTRCAWLHAGCGPRSICSPRSCPCGRGTCTTSWAGLPPCSASSATSTYR